MKLQKWFWGLFFLMAGAGIIINQLGYFGNINMFTLVFTILLIPIMIKSMTHLNFAGILFPLAIIGILFEKQLGITELTPWPILLTALFLSIGLTILFHKKSCSWNKFHYQGEHFDTIINEDDDNIVDVSVNFGSSIKYVNSKDFQKGGFHCSFGALKVYFDNAILNENGAEIILDASFAGVELYIPKTWNISNQISASLAGVEEKNRSYINDGPTVTLKGNISFSGVTIIYI